MTDVSQDGDGVMLLFMLILPEGYSVIDDVELPTINAIGIGFYGTSTLVDFEGNPDGKVYFDE